MGVPYKVTNKNGELKYVDASNGEATATYTKEVEVSTTNVVYFIPDLDGFVDPTDDTSGGDNDLFVMDAWETARYMGSLYFDEDPEETEKRLNESKEGSTMKKFNCSMQKKIESFKKSEKRTVTKSYDVYKYDELSDEAKEKVKELFLKWRGEDGSIFTEDCESAINDLFPNSDLNVQYSLSYSQGGGFNTYGKLRATDLINVDLEKYPLNGTNIKPLSDKNAIKDVCEKAGIFDITLDNNNHYCYSLADRIELDRTYEDELSEDEIKLLDELEKFAQDVFGEINSKFEDNGYDYFYEMSEDEVREEADANDYEFTEDGELA